MVELASGMFQRGRGMPRDALYPLHTGTRCETVVEDREQLDHRMHGPPTVYVCIWYVSSERPSHNAMCHISSDSEQDPYTDRGRWRWDGRSALKSGSVLRNIAAAMWESTVGRLLAVAFVPV